MPDPSILLIGDARRAEFVEAGALLAESGRLARAEDVEAAAAELEAGRVTPDLIVLAQAHPGQFTTRSIDRLRHLAPLARMLALLGSWCEGEMRTGNPPPGVIRVYWHEWLPRCSRELDLLRAGVASGWGLPPTATDEERLLAAEDREFNTQTGLVAICARQYETHDWLSAACRRRGYSTAWLSPDGPINVEGVRAAIFDGTDCDPVEVERIGRLAESIGPAPVIALLGFPRIEDYQRALSAGAAAVLSKPLLLDDLYWQLEHCATAPPPRRG